VKVSMRPGRCQGYGYCHDTAPDVFELDESGFSTLVATGSMDVPASLEAEAATGVEACPIRAIVAEGRDGPDGG
jgi:ferredoxin